MFGCWSCTAEEQWKNWGLPIQAHYGENITFNPVTCPAFIPRGFFFFFSHHNKRTLSFLLVKWFYSAFLFFSSLLLLSSVVLLQLSIPEMRMRKGSGVPEGNVFGVLQSMVVPCLVCTRRGKEKAFIKGCETLGHHQPPRKSGCVCGIPA